MYCLNEVQHCFLMKLRSPLQYSTYSSRFILKDYPRVTQIISPYSGYSKVPRNYLEAACERGSAIHKACECYLKGEKCDLKTEWGHYLMSFVMVSDLIKNVHSTETTLQDHDLKYRGTYDLLGELEGYPGLTLVDFKTSYAPQKTWHLQLSAYKNLIEKNGTQVDRVVVFHLQRTGNAAKIIEYENIKESFDEFSTLCTLWHRYKPSEEFDCALL